MQDTHSFSAQTPAGLECDDCGVTVEPDHVEALTIGCPAGGCAAPANHGEACVFVLADADGRVECSYCERPGDPSGRWDGGFGTSGDEDDFDLDELLWEGAFDVDVPPY